MPGRKELGVSPVLLTVVETAVLLNIPTSTAYLLIERGVLPGVIRVGRSIRISRGSLDAWIREQASPMLDDEESIVRRPS